MFFDILKNKTKPQSNKKTNQTKPKHCFRRTNKITTFLIETNYGNKESLLSSPKQIIFEASELVFFLILSASLKSVTYSSFSASVKIMRVCYPGWCGSGSKARISFSSYALILQQLNIHPLTFYSQVEREYVSNTESRTAMKQNIKAIKLFNWHTFWKSYH